MLAQTAFFIVGIVIMGIIMFPVLRSYKKRIRSMEATLLAAQNADSDGASAGFTEKLKNLAALAIESAGAISFSGGSTAGNIEKIERIIDENARIAAEIVNKTNSVATIASKMEDDVLRGFTVLETNVKKMEDIREKNSGVINGIVLLSGKVNKIRDIVRVINTITDQTKVIAFNAALEAASAGETGKRFAVVAGEVNRLADDIAVLTRQIREQTEEIQNSSSSLIVYSEDGCDKIAEGYKLIKDLEDIFKEIKSGAEITSNQTQTITVSIQQQLKSNEQIYSAVAEVSREVKHFIGAAETAAVSAGTLTKQAQELEQFLVADNDTGTAQRDILDKHGD
jgi:methyl-accepting chemotaxis protein